jgi:hypothetical protein
MFLSDELIEVGRKSNKKNNLSMNHALQTILGKCDAKIILAQPADKTVIRKQVNNAFNLAMKILYKEGYTFFNPDKYKAQ